MVAVGAVVVVVVGAVVVVVVVLGAVVVVVPAAAPLRQTHTGGWPAWLPPNTSGAPSLFMSPAARLWPPWELSTDLVHPPEPFQ